MPVIPTAPTPPPAGPGRPYSIDSPDMRRAGRELLSLALIDSRNQTLQVLQHYQDALGSPLLAVPRAPDMEPPLWLAGHIGWFAEWWIARNTQRAFGVECPARPTRLAAIDPHADTAWNPQQSDAAQRWAAALPDLDQARSYLLETLEVTLELLEKAAETDTGLYFYRLALLHEDLRREELIVMAQTLGIGIDLIRPRAVVVGPALAFPATRWTLGLPAGLGFAFAQELGAHAVQVPEFEIDAQPVNWRQFVEFVDDGGYDRADLWAPEGWNWVQREGRRAPRHVEQIGAARPGGGALLQVRFGTTERAGTLQAATHLAWWEADAWARWAGRRIATEVEWEIAAHTTARTGFRWGEVQEWTAGTLRPWPGYSADPWSAGGAFDPEPAFGHARVLRGYSFVTPERLRLPRWRAFAAPGRDDGFFGFRTCAI